MDFELLFQQIVTGEIWRAAVGVWFSALGNLAIPVLWFTLMIPLYIKTRSIITVCALTLAFSSAVIAFLPSQFHGPIYVMMALAVGGIIARLLIRW